MLTYQKRFGKPEKLKRFTGLRLEQFTLLAGKLKPLWTASEQKRLNHSDRKRAIGADRKYQLTTIEGKLLLMLLWYRTYAVYDLLGWSFDLEVTNIGRLTAKLTPLIETAADPNLLLVLKTIHQQRKNPLLGRVYQTVS